MSGPEAEAKEFTKSFHKKKHFLNIFNCNVWISGLISRNYACPVTSGSVPQNSKATLSPEPGFTKQKAETAKSTRTPTVMKMISL